MSVNLRSTFDREFGAIQQMLLEMGSMLDWAIDRAMFSLKHTDQEQAQAIIEMDERVNELRYKIEEACLTLIATQQPAASDLRAVIAAIHIAVEMERMGDHAAGIAKTVILMSEEPLLKTIKKIPKMAELSRQMLADCLQAYVLRDADWARRIAAQDAKMDQLYKAVFDRLIEIMAKKTELIPRATYLSWTAHNLERIADRVTNIAERIIFMTTGDVKELNVS
jgi:phosphate transport system protein